MKLEKKELIDFPNYFIQNDGKIFFKDKELKPYMQNNKHKNGKIYKNLRIQTTVNGKRETHQFGIAKLVAEYFIPNPKNYKYVIFKDKNHMNCCADNIVWVSGEIFVIYSGNIKGREKKTYEREIAIERATDFNMRAFYETLDEYWLQKAWTKLDKDLSVNFYKWNEVRSACFIHFMDRAKRFSIFRDPCGLIINYARLERHKTKLEECNTNLSYTQVSRIEEYFRETIRR